MTQSVFINYCRWNSTTSGTAAFTVGAAAAPDDAGAHDIPANCGAINGNLYRYYAQSADGLQTEIGRGTYNSAAHTLARTTVFDNSDHTLVPINFTSLPIVDVFPVPNPSIETRVFDVGTAVLFQQTAAPTGWTKQTT